MSKKDKYQEYLLDSLVGKERSLKRLFYKISNKNRFLKKKFYELQSWSIPVLKKIPNIKKAKDILEIGTGTGANLEYIRYYINSDATFYATDIGKSSILPEFINFHKNDIENENLPFEENSMDVLISTFVIEHLRNPFSVFEKAYRVLKPGGYLCIVTDYYPSVVFPDYWNFYSDPTHVRPFTKRSLEILGGMAGFNLHKVGVIRKWEFLPLLPFVPILNVLSASNFSFIPFEIIGRAVYYIGKK